MEDYKPNSNKYHMGKAKEESEIHRESVVKGKVSIRQKSSIQKAIEVFFVKDVEDVKNYLIYDVLLPELKDALYNLINNGAQMFLYGNARNKRYPNNNGGIRISYNKCSENPKIEHSSSNNGLRNGTRLDDVTFEDRSDAEEVLNSMVDILETYGSVSIAEFCELANRPDEYTDRKYGWTNLATAEVRRMSGGGYYIKFPKATMLPKN